ncbi:protein-S-isoprenylcysteine O-methyltransferase, partial [Cryptotermes secundus]|uniref:protein-S-isoprenylcysteine O-methyltransferase n=1 Tax=Cryptotermes secundus TaxID=105785 RepID=UPI000CD7DE55
MPEHHLHTELALFVFQLNHTQKASGNLARQPQSLDLKEATAVSLIGMLLCVGGEFLRKLAVFTAKTNFNHVVQSVHEEGHQLVTHGVYNYCRHPSYVGWFYWSIGTQLILVNLVCIVAYVVASWKFFNERVFIEENMLLHFFGDDYYQYQKRVSTGLPFILGYKLEL